MNDTFAWSINLGRWAGVWVRIHLAMVLFILCEIVGAAATRDGPGVSATLAWIGLLFVVLAIHEFAHFLTANRLGIEPEDVRLWPLGNLVGPISPTAMRSTEGVLVAAAGPLVNGSLALAVAIGLNALTQAHMVFHPFGNGLGSGGAPLLEGGKTAAESFTIIWFIGWFGYLNWVVFLANLVPALPMDGGRVYRGLLENPWGGTARDKLVGPITAWVCAIVLGLWGAVYLVKGHPGWWVPLGLALLIYTMARLEARMMDEGGFFDDTLFGYDFSQGYTSLEANAATVRPRREGALRRWRRRRSELRRQRQAARDAAEEARMDTILEKLHREGRASLTDEETRFLVRVSARFKNRPARSRD